jgi:uncharacterized protein YukE
MAGQFHMVPDECRATENNMNSTHDAISDSVKSISNAVEGMVGATWIAPGADTYKNDFQQWVTSMNQALEQLQQLAQRLESEIRQWEETAQTS